MEPEAPNGRKRAVVTGGASGLGLAVSERLARAGVDVVIVGRDAERLAAAQRRVDEQAGRAAATTLLTPDLSVVGEVAKVADSLAREVPRIDILVHNAGALFSRRTETSDGIERTFALNVLAPFALTYRLGAALARAPRARVVNVSSAAHRGQRLLLEDLQMRERYRGYRAYGRSKLALLLLTRAFARRWAATTISLYAVHPGLVRTHFGQNNPGILGWGFRVALGLFGTAPQRAARSPCSAALDPSLAGTSGVYLSGGKVRAGSKLSNQPELGELLFEKCRELTGLTERPLVPDAGA